MDKFDKGALCGAGVAFVITAIFFILFGSHVVQENLIFYAGQDNECSCRINYPDLVYHFQGKDQSCIDRCFIDCGMPEMILFNSSY